MTRCVKLLPVMLLPSFAVAPALAQKPALLATPAVEIASVTGELLGQASVCRIAADRLNKIESRTKAALGRAAANQSDYDYALTRFEEEKISGAERQRRRVTGLDCGMVRQLVGDLERRRF
jgi:hypothetical protein